MIHIYIYKHIYIYTCSRRAEQDIGHAPHATLDDLSHGAALYIHMCVRIYI